MARKLIAEGKGEEKIMLSDYEGSKGTYSIYTTPAAYLSWFDPDGAMNEMAAIKNMNPAIPVLFIVPASDYPGLLKVKQLMFPSQEPAQQAIRAEFKPSLRSIRIN